MENRQEHTEAGCSLPKSQRLRGEKTIDRLFREGGAGFVYPFRFITREEEGGDGEPVRILFSVPKRYHKRANKRNLLKRRSREAFRQGKAELSARMQTSGKRLQIALIYSSKEIEDYRKIENAVRRIISQIQSRG